MKELLAVIKKTKSLNLLFVEDSDIVRMSAITFFEEFFNEIFVGINGKEGLASYLENKDDIDIIISDINMPIMNGYDMIELIREEDKEIPILILTGSRCEDADINIKRYNIQAILEKPIALSEFIASLNKIL